MVGVCGHSDLAAPGRSRVCADRMLPGRRRGILAISDTVVASFHSVLIIRCHSVLIIRCQGCKMRGPRFGIRCAVTPYRTPFHINGRSGGEMLEPSYRPAHILTVPQPTGADAWGKRPGNARPFVIVGLSLCWVLVLPKCLQCVVCGRQLAGHMTQLGLCLRIARPHRTVATVLHGALDTNDRIQSPIQTSAP